jgi:hypothetical protein
VQGLEPRIEKLEEKVGLKLQLRREQHGRLKGRRYD